MTALDYREFLATKVQLDGDAGFEPVWIPDFLFDFQAALVEWAVRKGRAAIFADCGLGKSPMQLVYAENIVRKTNGRVLILTPIAVSFQTAREAEKFGIEARRSNDGTAHRGITITNYERLHLFNASDFVGVVLDESSILKNFDGVRKAQITEFLRTRPYRLTCTATAAPNDYIELGTTSEALGYLGYMDMLTKFFKNDQRGVHPNSVMASNGWRFRGHAERDFWRWVCSWARAIRKPSDLGFDDGPFVLPPLITREHVIATAEHREGRLWAEPARTLEEQRAERKRTLRARCELAASLVADTGLPAVTWCHLNPEGDLLQRLIPGAVQVAGSDPDEAKEEKFLAFVRGDASARVMVTKETIAGFGTNWQHCSHTTTFPSHSLERYYQSVRRFWRFGQERPVLVEMVTSEGESGVLANLQRKSQQLDQLFARLVEAMNNELAIRRAVPFQLPEDLPSWLSSTRN
jgi:hypothetical protein